MIDAENDPRWFRIQGYPLDDPSSDLPFTRRLARENRWTVDFSVRVVQEYRRFCYLAVAAGHPVTPSDEVDQAWHLHLLYTRDYWEAYCPNVLGCSLHHGPTKGGASEGDRFEDQYRKTLRSYERLFGEEPPFDVWPPPSVRFGPRMIGVRVLPSEVWIVPKLKTGFRRFQQAWMKGG